MEIKPSELTNKDFIIKLLIIWMPFVPKKWRAFKEQLETGKTFKAAYDIARKI